MQFVNQSPIAPFPMNLGIVEFAIWDFWMWGFDDVLDFWIAGVCGMCSVN